MKTFILLLVAFVTMSSFAKLTDAGDNSAPQNSSIKMADLHSALKSCLFKCMTAGGGFVGGVNHESCVNYCVDTLVPRQAKIDSNQLCAGLMPVDRPACQSYFKQKKATATVLPNDGAPASNDPAAAP